VESRKFLNVDFKQWIDKNFKRTLTEDRGTALQAGRSRVRFPMMSLEFFIDVTQSNKKNFLGALVFRPVPGVIWGADSEKCTG
jgi:hypothetical protein